MIVKHFGCTAIHNKALYKCIIHSFILTFYLLMENTDVPNLNIVALNPPILLDGFNCTMLFLGNIFKYLTHSF